MDGKYVESRGSTLTLPLHLKIKVFTITGMFCVSLKDAHLYAKGGLKWVVQMVFRAPVCYLFEKGSIFIIARPHV